MSQPHSAFWGEIAPCDHVVQLYDHDDAFLDSLETFIVDGLNAQEGVVLVATPQHRWAISERLIARGFDLAHLRSETQLVDIDAERALARFMRNNWPDERLFRWMVADLLALAGKNGRKVRAFGEMVALLWAQGHSGATVRLELLWNQLCQSNQFALFCAYPKAGFTNDAEESLRKICEAHSKVVV